MCYWCNELILGGQFIHMSDYWGNCNVEVNPFVNCGYLFN